MTERGGRAHRAARLGRRLAAQDDRAAAGLLRHVRRRRGRADAPPRRADVMFATSPPLPGALAAARRRRRAGGCRSCSTCATSGPPRPRRSASSPTRASLRCFERAERWLYQHAARVTATTRPFCAPHRRGRRPRRQRAPAQRRARRARRAARRAPPPPGPFTVGYAGNFGIAQGLGIVLDAAEALRGADVRFVLVGDGPAARASCATERDRARPRRGRDPPRRAGGRRRRACCSPATRCWSRCATTRCCGDFIPSKLYDAMAVGRPALVAAPGEAGRARAASTARARGRAGGRRRARGRGPRAASPTPRREPAGRRRARPRPRELRALATGRAARGRAARCRRRARELSAPMCGIIGVWSRDGQAVDPERGRTPCATRCATAAPTTRACGAARTRRRRARPPPAGDRRPQRRRAAADGQRGRHGPGHVQRRDLQPRRAARGARGARATASARAATPRCSCTSTRSTARRWSTASSACSRSRSGTSGDESLLLARDRLGIKPLYWVDDGRRFALRLGDQGAAAAARRAASSTRRRSQHYLTFVAVAAAAHAVPRRVQARRRPRRCGSTRSGPPVTATLLGPDRATARTFDADDVDWEAELRFRLERSIRRRMMSDVPVGVFLSGGVDSSTNVALMSRARRPARCNTFSIGFHGAESFNELDWARRVAEQFGTDHHEVKIDADDLWALPARARPPPGRADRRPRLRAAAFRRPSWPSENGVTVVHVGEGADELFAGYPTYVTAHAMMRGPWRRLRALPGPLRSARRRRRRGRASGSAPGTRSTPRRWRAAPAPTARPVVGRRRRVLRARAARGRPRPALRAQLDGRAAPRDSSRAIADDADALRRARRARPADLPGPAAAAARAAADARRQAHDGQLDRGARAVPRPRARRAGDGDARRSRRSRGGIGKLVLKRAVGDLLPHDLIWRPKQGFGAPVAQWFRGDARRRACSRQLRGLGDPRARLSRPRAHPRAGRTARERTRRSLVSALEPAQPLRVVRSLDRRRGAGRGMSAPVLVVVGARPNFVKVAPVVARARGAENRRQRLLHTGQHYDHAALRQLPRAARPARARRGARDRLRHPCRADRGCARGGGAGAAGRRTRRGARRRRRELDARGGARRREGRRAGHPPRGGPAVRRLDDAGGDQPRRLRSPVGSAAVPEPRRGRGARGRGHRRRSRRARGQHDDRHAAAPVRAGSRASRTRAPGGAGGRLRPRDAAPPCRRRRSGSADGGDGRLRGACRGAARALPGPSAHASATQRDGLGARGGGTPARAARRTSSSSRWRQARGSSSPTRAACRKRRRRWACPA